MASVHFDPLKFVEQLKAASVPEAQAKVMAEALASALSTSDVATVRDLERLEQEMNLRFEKVDNRIDRLESHMQIRFEQLERKMDQRFLEQDAKMDQRFLEQEAKYESRFQEFEARVDKRFLEQEAKIGQRFLEQDAKYEKRFATIEAQLRLHNWMLSLLMAGVASLVLKSFFI